MAIRNRVHLGPKSIHHCSSAPRPRSTSRLPRNAPALGFLLGSGGGPFTGQTVPSTIVNGVERGIATLPHSEERPVCLT